MSLREGVVAALHAETETWGYKAGIYELLNEAHDQLLDALLDFLDAHTEEWEEASIVVEEHGDRAYRSAEIEHNLVAALRGTTEEGELK